MKSKLIIILATLATMVFSPSRLAEAADLNGQMDNWLTTLTTAGGLFKVAVGFGGAIFAFMGIVGLKKYADDNRQNPLMKPLIMFFAGALALGFSTFTGQLAKSGTDSDEDGANQVFTE